MFVSFFAINVILLHRRNFLKAVSFSLSFFDRLVDFKDHKILKVMRTPWLIFYNFMIFVVDLINHSTDNQNQNPCSSVSNQFLKRLMDALKFYVFTTT